MVWFTPKVGDPRNGIMLYVSTIKLKVLKATAYQCVHMYHATWPNTGAPYGFQGTKAPMERLDSDNIIANFRVFFLLLHQCDDDIRQWAGVRKVSPSFL